MSEKTVIVNNKKTGLVGFENVVLLPGANTISVSVAKSMQAHPVIKAMIEEDQLEFPEISEEKGISELSQGDALDLVKSTVHVDLLEDWKKSDKRKPVLKAIDEQLAKLAAPTELRGKQNANKVE